MREPPRRSEQRLAQAGETVIVEVRELAARLGVRVARRPWPRRKLTQAERRRLQAALVRGRYELDGRTEAPRELATPVRVRSVAIAARADRAARARRIARWTLVKPAGFVVGLVAFAGALSTLRPVVFGHEHRPSLLAGDLKVAVVAFGVRGHHSEAQQQAATELAHTLSASLKRELADVDPVVVVDVRWSSDRAFAGSLKTESDAASKLAAQSGADAVIFGEVRDADDATTLVPYVYLSPRRLPRAGELAGAYPMGDPIALPVALGVSSPADGMLRRTLAARGRGLAEFVDAIGYYALERFAAAIEHLRAAAREPSWSSASGRAMLDLFLGNATGKLAEGSRSGFASAASFYRAALARDPRLTRARFGLAEIDFQRAHGSCTTATVDRRGLASALASYRAVLRASSRPPRTSDRVELSLKAHFGVGRVYLCESQAGLAADWERAARELELVRGAYTGEPLLRDDSAEAWADLAIVELPSRGQRDQRAAYATARSSYSRAIALMRAPAALATLYANRAYIDMRLGDRASARSDYRAAARIAPGPSLRRRWAGAAAAISAARSRSTSPAGARYSR